MAEEITVPAHTPMPKGYSFARKGNVYITAHVRKQTHEANLPLFVVVNKKNVRTGLRCPSHILAKVRQAEEESRERRGAAVRKRDDALHDAFRNDIVKYFPGIPKEEIPAILKQTLRKRCGRVGRAGTIDVSKKAFLAVTAHIRHCHTDYDELLKTDCTRDQAREKVGGEVRRITRLWKGERPKSKQKQTTKKATGKPKKTTKAAKATAKPQVTPDTEPRPQRRRSLRSARETAEQDTRKPSRATKQKSVAGSRTLDLGCLQGETFLEIDSDFEMADSDVEMEAL